MKTIVYIATSIDGFIARKNGDIDWLSKYESNEIYESYNEFIASIDAIVIGRGTFEKVLSFPEWPYRKKVFVISSQMKNIPEKLEGKVSLVSMYPKEIISHLSGLGYSNIYVDGGKVVQSFLKEDLIDEMIITRAPVLIGSGIPLFGYLEKDINFKHTKTNAYSNGLVMSFYERLKN